MNDELWDTLCGMAPLWTMLMAINGMFLLLLVLSFVAIDDEGTWIIWTFSSIISGVTFAGATFVRVRCSRTNR